MSSTTPDTSVTFTWTWTTYSQLIMALIGVIGNGLVIAVYNRKRQSTSATNELLVALAVADLMTSILLIPLPIWKNVPSDWRGQIYCKLVFSDAFVWTAIAMSVFTLTVVSFERYLAISYPSKYPLVFSSSSRSKIVAGIWIVSILLNAYIFAIWISVDGKCQIVWLTPWMPKLLGVTLFLLKYLLPVGIMSVTQIATSFKLNLQRQELLARGVDKSSPAFLSLEVKSRVVAMLRVVVITFILCWSANQVGHFGYTIGLKPFRYFLGTFYRYSVQLAFLNSILNPFIYAFTNASFRDGLRQLLLCRSPTPTDSLKTISATAKNAMTGDKTTTFTVSIGSDYSMNRSQIGLEIINH
ncbi:galanin receptor 2a-like [Amphiura filiformis]|uniref:galanin receptor 2a-like n=1 Tax=Amphiura filiformis TaxID=82378 RepID=UPI003B2286F6